MYQSGSILLSRLLAVTYYVRAEERERKNILQNNGQGGGRIIWIKISVQTGRVSIQKVTISTKP